MYQTPTVELFFNKAKCCEGTTFLKKASTTGTFMSFFSEIFMNTSQPTRNYWKLTLNMQLPAGLRFRKPLGHYFCINYTYFICFADLCLINMMIGYNFNELILSMASELISSKQCFDWNIEVKKYFKEVFPATIFLFKVNNKKIRTMYEICSKLTIKTPAQSLCVKSVQS